MSKRHQGTSSKKEGQTAGKKRKHLPTGLILAGILLVGLVLRVSYLREISQSPDFAYPLVDAAYHNYWARSLATGDWTIHDDMAIVNDPEIRTTAYFRPPGYPVLLTLIYYVSNGSYLAPRIVQMAAGLIGAVLAYFLGKRVFGRTTGLIFAALIATYWAFIFFEGELLGEALLLPLGLALVYGLCWWYAKRTPTRALVCGILFGVFAVIRPNILLFGPALLIWCWWVQRRRKPRGAIAGTWLGFALGAIAIIAPVTIRNYVVAKDSVLISSNMGINLYIGNNENSTGQYSVFPAAGTLTEQNDWDCSSYPLIVRGVEAQEGHRMKDSEVSSYFAHKAIDYIWTHKLRAVKLALTKTLLFWGPTEAPSNKDIGLQKRDSATLSLLPGFPLALALAVIGFALLGFGHHRRRGGQTDVVVTDEQFELSILAVLFIVSYFFSVLPFFVVGRFRVPVIPFLLLFGAYALAQIGHWIVIRDLKHAALWGGTAVVAYVVASIPLIPHEYDEVRPHLLRANCYRLAGKLDLAIDECREAIRLDPNSEKGHHRLADLLLSQNRYADAVAHYEMIPSESRHFDVECNLSLAYRSLGDLDHAIEHMRRGVALKPDMAELHYRLGNLLRRDGQGEDAIESLRQAVALDPDYVPACQDLAAALLTQQRFAEAVTELRKALARHPDEPNLHNFLGIALKSTGDLQGAVGEYRRAIALDPNDYQAHNNLGNALLALNQVDEAIAEYRRALEIEPSYTTARQMLNRILSAQGSSEKPTETERTAR